jgi:hypothetical protein
MSSEKTMCATSMEAVLKNNTPADTYPVQVTVRGKELFKHGFVRLGGIDLKEENNYVLTLGEYPLDVLPTHVQELLPI